MTPPSVTTQSSQPTWGWVGPRKHFIVPSIHRFVCSTWDIVVCLFCLYVHVLCEAPFSFIQNKIAMMLSLGIKTPTSYMEIDVMSSECSSQSGIPFICNSYLLLLADSSSCSGTSSPPSIPETFLAKKRIRTRLLDTSEAFSLNGANLLRVFYPMIPKVFPNRTPGGKKQSDGQMMDKG